MVVRRCRCSLPGFAARAARAGFSSPGMAGPPCVYYALHNNDLAHTGRPPSAIGRKLT